jgi:hypothetical protein
VLYRDFVDSTNSAQAAKSTAKEKEGADAKALEVSLWPRDLMDFLAERLHEHFEIAAYILDPDKVSPPDGGIAKPQTLGPDAIPMESDPFLGLLQIDEIPAQRGFGDDYQSGGNEAGKEGGSVGKREARKLARQFRDYFLKHLDPFDKPAADDIRALKAMALS